MKWFQVLLFYGHEEGEAPIVSDDDNILIPLIIDKAVLPKLTSKYQGLPLINIVLGFTPLINYLY